MRVNILFLLLLSVIPHVFCGFPVFRLWPILARHGANTMYPFGDDYDHVPLSAHAAPSVVGAGAATGKICLLSAGQEYCVGEKLDMGDGLVDQGGPPSPRGQAVESVEEGQKLSKKLRRRRKKKHYTGK